MAKIKKMEKLKPCPYCGREARIHDVFFPYVECTGCGYQTDAYPSVEDAVHNWNQGGRNASKRNN